MRFISTMVAVAALSICATTGCTKKEDGGAVTTTSATVAAAASSAPKPDCAAGMTKVEQGGFCIKLPDGYAFDKAKGTPPEDIEVEFTKNGSSFSGFTVRVSTTETEASRKDTWDMHTGDKHNMVVSGDLPGGKGQFFISTPKAKEMKDWATLSFYLKGPKGMFICESSGNSGAETVAHHKEELEICKTITPIGG